MFGEFSTRSYDWQYNFTAVTEQYGFIMCGSGPEFTLNTKPRMHNQIPGKNDQKTA